MTELLDRRVFAAGAIVIPLHGALPASPSPIAEALVVHDGLILEDILYRLSDSGEGPPGRRSSISYLTEPPSTRPLPTTTTAPPGPSKPRT